MNDNLEKELNEIENVEKQNQEHLKNIDSKVDELNELVNNINEKNVVDDKNIGGNNNVIMNSNNTIQIQPQKDKTLVDVKKEIFVHRKLVRWTSFCSIFLCLWFIIYLVISINSIVINCHLNFYIQILNNNGIGNFVLNNLIGSYNVLILGLFYPLLILYVSFIVSNIILFCKLKYYRKLYLSLFIFSFIFPILTWLYCMGIMAFMKHKNKINYYEWLKEKKVDKYNKKINHCKNCK